MTWIAQNKRAWRALVLAIAIVAFVGPWTGEAVPVPAGYTCSFPNFRLDGDFCGFPLPGWQIFFLPISRAVEIVRALALSEVDRALKSLSLALAVTLVFLPILTEFVLIIGRDHQSGFRIVVWGLAAIAVSFLALIGFSRFHPALWGISLYFGLSVTALLLELAAFFTERKFSPG